jgi:predicted  nucleic acid-binding Zn-ribbon protein
MERKGDRKRKALEPLNTAAKILDIEEEIDRMHELLAKISSYQLTLQESINGVWRSVHRLENSTTSIYEEIRDTLAHLQTAHFPKPPSDDGSDSGDSFLNFVLNED